MLFGIESTYKEYGNDLTCTFHLIKSSSSRAEGKEFESNGEKRLIEIDLEEIITILLKASGKPAAFLAKVGYIFQ